MGCLLDDRGAAMAMMKIARSGQMTVEFVAMFPVALVIALTAVNAMLFFSECASFDREFRSAVCTQAVSPKYGQSVEQSCAIIEGQLAETYSEEHLAVTVSSEGTAGTTVKFTGELAFSPTLFGKGALTGVFGVSFPSLRHATSISVDVYKPGVIL